MSGLEALLASAFTGLTTTGTAAAGAGAAGTAAAAGLGAAEIAAIAGGTAEALAGGGIASGLAPAAGAAAAGLTTAEALAAGASLAGSASQMLTSAPKIDLPQAPTRDDARLEMDRRSNLLRRRGRAATLLTSPSGVQSSPTLGTPSLTGYG